MIQLAKHGGVANVAGSVAKMLPFVLKVQECGPGVRARGEANADLPQVPRVSAAAPRGGGGGHAGGDEGFQSVARESRGAQVLLSVFLPPLVHAVRRRDGGAEGETFDRLCDAQIECGVLARDTLVGFLKGVGAVSAAAAGVRARCLAAAAELPPRRRGRPPERRRRLRRRSTRPVRRREDAERGRQGDGGTGASSVSARASCPRLTTCRNGCRKCWRSSCCQQPNPVKDTVRLAFSEFKKTLTRTRGRRRAQRSERAVGDDIDGDGVGARFPSCETVDIIFRHGGSWVTIDRNRGATPRRGCPPPPNHFEPRLFGAPESFAERSFAERGRRHSGRFPAARVVERRPARRPRAHLSTASSPEPILTRFSVAKVPV